LEPELESVIRRKYANDLERQRMEIAEVEKEVDSLKSDLARRRAALDRVVKIRTGQLILEAEGLLDSQN
ncbi:MAG: hypothetical protein AB8B50_04995, partial [Pirellulaceae bacterium]